MKSNADSKYYYKYRKPPVSRKIGYTNNSNSRYENEKNTQALNTYEIKGIVELLTTYGFIRGRLLPHSTDVYVSGTQIAQYMLRTGDEISGRALVSQSNSNSKGSVSDTLYSIDTINGVPIQELEKNKRRVDFNKLRPVHPNELLMLQDSEESKSVLNVINLISPIGKGQRGLIVAPPKTGKTTILRYIAQSVLKHNTECKLIILLIDERPEEVSELEELTGAEIVASTFDRPADEHIAVTELTLERAKRMVEMGKDVIILLDSITRLSRAYNVVSPDSGRVLTGGLDFTSLYPPKRFLGAARNMENGGSLTILATALIDTGSKMDDVIFEEFKGTGNMELRLDRGMASHKVYPAIDIADSGTRKEELLYKKGELESIWKLRKALLSMNDMGKAISLLTNKLSKYTNLSDFLEYIRKSGF